MAAGGPGQAGDPSAQRAQQPPAEVRGIVAKLMAFVKVRPGPLTAHLWSSSSALCMWCWSSCGALSSCGAFGGGRWRASLTALL